MAKRYITKAILDYLNDCSTKGLGSIGADAITAQVGVSRPTVNRYLAKMAASGSIIREGAGPGTGYRLAYQIAHEKAAIEVVHLEDLAVSITPTWDAEALALRAQLEMPMGVRPPVSYQRRFVDDYAPNQSSLLPPHLAESLFAEGRAQGQLPAGTYARKVLEQLLIDLSWHSSRLEGNRKSLLDTRELFAKGRSAGDDLDSAMLLNHKDAIEFMVDAVPEYGITVPVVRNVQSLLMQGLLENPESVGAIRKSVVNITDSVYLPTQVPSLLEEMLGHVVHKARNVKNPAEAAFFLWVNLAYLQPFEDGNKRTSRLCANLPLMLANCAPLSFLDVDSTDYALAILGVYEQQNVTLAVNLFEWTYRRSISKYRTILDSMGAPNPFRAKYREHLGEAVRQVVESRSPIADAVAALELPVPDQAPFHDLLREELRHLEPFNCARYRLPMGKTEDWISMGRPM